MIPLVGQPFEAVYWYPTAIVYCNCRATEGIKALLVLTGINNPVACGHCHRHYLISGIKASAEGSAELVIAYSSPQMNGAQ